LAKNLPGRFFQGLPLDDAGDGLPGDLQLLGNLPQAQSLYLVHLPDLVGNCSFHGFLLWLGSIPA
jgi:hypothetical protein